MNASDWALVEQEVDGIKCLLGELYQILGQFQGEIPEETLDKILAHIYGEHNGKFADAYESLLPFVRGD